MERPPVNLGRWRGRNAVLGEQCRSPQPVALSSTDYFLMALPFVSLCFLVVVVVVVVYCLEFLRQDTTDFFIHLHAGHFFVVVAILIPIHAPYSLWLARRMRTHSNSKQMMRIISRVTSIWSRVVR